MALSAAKAKKILEDGFIRGKALTEKQKKFFGAIAGGATPLKKINGGWLDKFQNGGDVSFDSVQRAIRNVESLDGKLMWNPESTATGLYGQLFSQVKDDYSGTRKEFAKDTIAQKKFFKNRFFEGLPSTQTTSLVQDANDIYNEYAPQIPNFNYSKEDLAVLSNFLGRQGTREYLGYHVRDKKPLEKALPNIYGPDAKQRNKTPEQYLKQARKYYKEGGWLDKFNNGGVQPNYNDSNVSLPPGFKGWGYDKGGRAYNGAWDGPVTRMGGTIPGATGMMYARTSGTSPEEPKKAQDGGRCWPGYKAVAGKTPFSKGSCQKAQDGYMVPPRKGVRKNPDGTESTHLMKAEQLEDGTWVGFPSLFQNSDGKWIDMSGEKDWMNIYNEALKRGEVIEFGKDKDAAIKFGEGSWKTPKKAQDGTVMYGTPEYEAAYREGRFADVPNVLDEVVITAGVDYEKYPLYDKLSKQQKEYFNDPGPIGRGVRRAAQTDRGLAEDTRDMVTGMLVQQPLSALQAPQSLMVEGIEALRGRDANFLNALTFDTQRTPSQAFNVQNPYGAFALDVVADPLNVVGVGLARKSLISPFKNALKPNPNMYYRGIGQAGLDDAIQSGLLRAKPADQIAPSMFGPFDLAKRFNSLYVTPRLGVAQRYGKGVVAEVPTDVANFSRRYKGSDWSMMTNQSIPVENVNFYKKNFFGNYRPVNVPSSTSSNFIEAAANPGIRSNLIRFGQDVMDTPSAQIRASERFNKDWFNNPEIIRRTEEMLNQPSTLRSGMSESELLQDITMYERMLTDAPNLTAAQEASMKRQLKDLYAAIAKKNLEKVQQKGRFSEPFDPKDLNLAKYYEDNPNVIGMYDSSVNQGTVNVPRTTKGGKNVGSTFTHEDLHAVTAGRKGYTDEATQILEDAVGKDQDWWLNKINTEKDPEVRKQLIETLEYLARPQEIHARVHELRKAFNLKPGQEVSASKIDEIMMKGLKGETPVDEAFFRLLSDKEKFRKIFNKLPAFVPAAVGLGAATQMKDGGWLDKFQEGGVIEDDRGQWAYPGEITKINSNNITMKGVNYPVLGISDTGDTKMMQPGKDYKFKGNSVTEFPMAQDGGEIIVSSTDDPRYRAYIDSLAAYNENKQTRQNWIDSDLKEYTETGNVPYFRGSYYRDEVLKKGDSLLYPEHWDFYGKNRVSAWENSYNNKGKNFPVNIGRTSLVKSNGKVATYHDVPLSVEYPIYAKPKQEVKYVARPKETPLNVLVKPEGYNFYNSTAEPIPPLTEFAVKEVPYNISMQRFLGAEEQDGFRYGTDGKGNLVKIQTREDYRSKNLRPNGKKYATGGPVELDQLTNFTNYNTPQPGGWLDKY